MHRIVRGLMGCLVVLGMLVPVLSTALAEGAATPIADGSASLSAPALTPIVTSTATIEPGVGAAATGIDVTITVYTTDNGALPATLLVCLDSACQTVADVVGNTPVASVTMVFPGIGPGTYQVVLTSPAPYTDTWELPLTIESNTSAYSLQLGIARDFIPGETPPATLTPTPYPTINPGSVILTLVIQTTDGGNLPLTTTICLLTLCQTADEILDGVPASSVTATFTGLGPGTYTYSILNTGMYSDVEEDSVTINPGVSGYQRTLQLAPTVTQTPPAGADVRISAGSFNNQPLPLTTTICLGERCQTADEILDGVAAAEVEASFENVPAGTYPISITNTAPYREWADTVTISPSTISLSRYVTLYHASTPTVASTTTAIATATSTATTTPTATGTSTPVGDKVAWIVLTTEDDGTIPRDATVCVGGRCQQITDAYDTSFYQFAIDGLAAGETYPVEISGIKPYVIGDVFSAVSMEAEPATYTITMPQENADDGANLTFILVRPNTPTATLAPSATSTTIVTPSPPMTIAPTAIASVSPSSTIAPSLTPTATSIVEGGHVVVMLETADGGPVPPSTRLCIEDVCQTAGEQLAGAATSTGAIFDLGTFPSGTYTLRVTEAAPYLDLEMPIAVPASGRVELVLSLQFPAPTAAPQTPDPQQATPLIPPTATSVPAQPSVPTSVAPGASAPKPSSPGDTTFTTTISVLPNTGTGSASATSIVPLGVALAILGGAIVTMLGVRRRGSRNL